MSKRAVEIVVISDVHLGTYGCHAKELLKYLKSIKPKTVILNGDIFDIWQFSKSYWPDAHMKVVRKILKFVTEGSKVYYLTGNHDEMFRKFAPIKVGKFELVNKLVLEMGDKKAWIFHGDIFDVTMQHSKWLAKLGAIGYDSLIILNSYVNWCLSRLGKEKMSFSKRIKGRFKDAVKFINDFETTAADLAIDKGYDYVICGHIHQPEIRKIRTANGTVLYLNSGDWVESLSALEYNKGEWNLYHYNLGESLEDETETEDAFHTMDIKELLAQFTG
jgi:UDP-2,3-diacylglucosamine pyrophosphatase LpxH